MRKEHSKNTRLRFARVHEFLAVSIAPAGTNPKNIHVGGRMRGLFEERWSSPWKEHSPTQDSPGVLLNSLHTARVQHAGPDTAIDMRTFSLDVVEKSGDWLFSKAIGRSKPKVSTYK